MKIIVTNHTTQNHVISQRVSGEHGRVLETTVPAMTSATVEIAPVETDQSDQDALDRFFAHNINAQIAKYGDEGTENAALTWDVAPPEEEGPLVREGKNATDVPLGDPRAVEQAKDRTPMLRDRMDDTTGDPGLVKGPGDEFARTPEGTREVDRKIEGAPFGREDAGGQARPSKEIPPRQQTDADKSVDSGF
jgi:hypothetical protein